MSIYAQFQAANPADIPLTLSLTMTLSEWRILDAQLGIAQKDGSLYPAWKVSNIVREMVALGFAKFDKVTEAE